MGEAVPLVEQVEPSLAEADDGGERVGDVGGAGRQSHDGDRELLLRAPDSGETHGDKLGALKGVKELAASARGRLPPGVLEPGACQ